MNFDLKDPPLGEGKYTQQLDQKLSKMLVDFLDYKDLNITEDRQKLRDSVIDRIEDELSEWIYSTYIKLNPGAMTHYRAHDASRRLAFIQPYGSTLLNTCLPTSDIDAVVVFPSYVESVHFFDGFIHALKNIKGAQQPQYIKGKHPILNVIIDGIEVDLQPAILSREVISRDVDWLEKTENLNITVKTREVVSHIANNLWIIEQLGPHKIVFEQANRLVKYQNQVCGIDSNKLGYFGGINVALLFCNLVIHNKDIEISLFQLIYNYYLHYSRFDFNKVLNVNPANEYTTQSVGLHPMHIPTPIKPPINSTSKVSDFTKVVLLQIWKRCKRSFEKMVQLIAAAYEQKECVPLLRPALCETFFMNIAEPVPQSGFMEFMLHPDFRAGFLVITLYGDDAEVVRQCRDKVEPMFTILFASFRRLMNEKIGGFSNIQYLRPWAGWFDEKQFQRRIHPGVSAQSFIVGVCKIQGEKDWLVKEIIRIIKEFREQIRQNLEKEDLNIQMVFSNSVINMHRRREILAEFNRLGVSGFEDHHFATE